MSVKNSVCIFITVTLLGIIIGLEGVQCLRVREVLVPPYRITGGNVELKCDFDLEDDQLYSVKWYKGYREFFRYVPADSPSIQVFDLPGVYVDLTKSTSNKVYLHGVSLKSSGKYKCEVSAEAPSFHTDSGSGELLVVEMPKNLPKITGVQQEYYMDDLVRVNCSSFRSKPAASLMWYINSKPADSSYLINYAPINDGEDLETSTLGLHFVARAHHLRHGRLQLKCTATIASVYYNETSVTAVAFLSQRIRRPKHSGIMLTGGASTYGSISVLSLTLALLYLEMAERR